MSEKKFNHRICVYVKNEAERDVVRQLLQNWRKGLQLDNTVELSPAQKQIRDDIMNTIADLKKSVDNITSIAQEPQKPQEQHPFVGPDPQAWLYDE